MASNSKEIYFLKQVSNQKYSKDFAVNLTQINNTLKSLSKYLIVIQNGIDDLNRDILEVIRDFIEEVIIIFNGGNLSDLDFEFGDLFYVFRAIGQFFGFPIWSGNPSAWTPFQMAKNFFDTFLSPFNFFQEAVGNLIDAVLDTVLGWLDFIPGVGTVRQKLAQAINNATASATVAELRADEVQAHVFEMEQIFSVRSSRPLWEGIDPTGESSFPVALMSEPTSHRHGYDVFTGAGWREGANSDYSGVSDHHVASDRSVGALIRIAADSTKKQLSFVARRTSSSGSLFIDVYKMNPNGSFSLQHSSPNRFADLLTSWAWRQIAIPDLSCALGDVILIQFRGASAQIAGIRMLSFTNALGFRPFQIGWSRTTSTAPSTIVTGDADAAYSPDIPYVQIGEDLGQVGAPRLYSDTFNRSSLGPNWIAMPRTAWGGSGLRIRSNERVENPSSQLIWQSAGSMYALPLSTDSMAVEFDLSGANSKITGVTMKSNFEGKRGVFLAVTSSGSQIVTTDDGWGTTDRVSRVTSGTGGNGRWRMEYRTSDNRYRVYKDGNLVMQWTDSGNTVRHGLGYRFCGMRIDHQAFDSGGWIDNWSAMDIT